MRTNTNHPQKGSSIKVEPIRNLEDIKAIKQLLQGKPRDLLLFTIGINNGLRIGDILNSLLKKSLPCRLFKNSKGKKQKKFKVAAYL